MTTQEKFDKAAQISKQARAIKNNFVEEQILKAEATFLTISPLEVSTGKESIDIKMTENSPFFTLNISDDWSDWDNHSLIVTTRMGSCHRAQAEDFLAMAKFAPVMEQVITSTKSEIENNIEDLNARTLELNKQAWALEDEAKKESAAAAKLAKEARLNRFNTEVLNQGKQELAETTSIQLCSDWEPKIKAIQVDQKPRQDSFTVTVWMDSWNGEEWKMEQRVCGSFKKNVMNLFD